MATQIPDDADKPLDPAVEKVRRKLLRFAVINIGLLFVALMAVLAAVVYKTSGDTPVAANGATVPSSAEDSFISGDIMLPAGAKVLSHALAGNRVSIDAELEDGSRAIFLYDMSERRIVGKLTLKTQ
ncbi:fimbrial protein [Pseudaminobacter arsenicus]|uniref:Fimbrial protein n=1 Tax=Borborobacter arsenicus TaxID=1851146 RepID=A0A432V105_9HYPH|nr:fimbrial protein [Pseudaminobacter arsenicus]RUM95778.1 fimbrial protein [Pseudaminobacter arsenicus]